MRNLTKNSKKLRHDEIVKNNEILKVGFKNNKVLRVFEESNKNLNGLKHNKYVKNNEVLEVFKETTHNKGFDEAFDNKLFEENEVLEDNRNNELL